MALDGSGSLVCNIDYCLIKILGLQLLGVIKILIGGMLSIQIILIQQNMDPINLAGGNSF
jgi:hypothetical protein